MYFGREIFKMWLESKIEEIPLVQIIDKRKTPINEEKYLELISTWTTNLFPPFPQISGNRQMIRPRSKMIIASSIFYAKAFYFDAQAKRKTQ